jgi:hypothetical protein
VTFNVRISGEGVSDDLRQLRIELICQAEWRGKVHPVEKPPEPGTLGPVLDALQVFVDPAAVSPFVAALVAWLRYRTSNIDLKVERTERGTTVTMSGKRLRRLDAAALTTEISKIVESLDPSDSGDLDA